jgi:hypothetical protein
MTKSKIENIKLRLNYKSQNSNGWPFIMIKINDQVVARFCAETTMWNGEFIVRLEESNTLKIEHYGKNYKTDQNPDRYFELEKIYINDVDLKYHIHRFKQTAFLAPWDIENPPEHSLYLGHNGYLCLEFGSPVDQWIQQLFGVTPETMHGQSTTREVLEKTKQYFGIN